MSEMTMREKIARALADRYTSKSGMTLAVEPYWLPWLNDTDAVLAAMREPSEALWFIGEEGVAAWRAMIDAALAESPEPTASSVHDSGGDQLGPIDHPVKTEGYSVSSSGCSVFPLTALNEKGRSD